MCLKGCHKFGAIPIKYISVMNSVLKCIGTPLLHYPTSIIAGDRSIFTYDIKIKVNIAKIYSQYFYHAAPNITCFCGYSCLSPFLVFSYFKNEYKTKCKISPPQSSVCLSRKDLRCFAMTNRIVFCEYRYI